LERRPHQLPIQNCCLCFNPCTDVVVRVSISFETCSFVCCFDSFGGSCLVEDNKSLSGTTSLLRDPHTHITIQCTHSFFVNRQIFLFLKCISLSLSLSLSFPLISRFNVSHGQSQSIYCLLATISSPKIS
jgi:hypothetical protein